MGNDARKKAVLKIAKKGGFDNVKKIEGQWNGYDVWTPCGLHGEALYIGAVCFVDMGAEIKPYILSEAENIFAEIEEAMGIYPSEYDD